jgi:ribonuclease Y
LALLLVGFVFLSRLNQQRKRELAEQAQEVEKERNGIDGRLKEALLEAKDEAHRLRKEVERENREQRQELQRTERRLSQREEGIERRSEALEKRDQLVEKKEKETEHLRTLVEKERLRWREELERVAGLTAEEARRNVLEETEQEARHEAAMLLEQI